MCGIVGVFARDHAEVDVEQVLALRDAMTHRGPDDAGLWRREPGHDVVFANRRLSIVDLSVDARQPMGNEDGSVQVTFNGEIYNHADLRADLERRGHRFRSRSDTEVLVHLYEEHGVAMVDRLAGMFAFALWDERREELVLARDRLGIKPLYWLERDHAFAFASEIKALLPLLPRRELDPTALLHYLSFTSTAPPRTLFRGVSKLAAATWMVVRRDGPPRVERYWDPIANRARHDGTTVDWAAQLRASLERSVESHLVSDVPVGAFLSGGLDSSTTTALMSRATSEPIDTFSIGYAGHERHDELGWARQVAARFATRHHEIEMDEKDFWRSLPALVHHEDEPISNDVAVPVYQLAKHAKERGVSVLHLGEGGDEVFAGYPHFIQAYRLERWFQPLPLPLRIAAARVAAPLIARRPGLEQRREALLRAAERDGRSFWGTATAFSPRMLERMTTPAVRRAADGEPPSEVIAATSRAADAAGARDPLDRIIYQDLSLRLPEQVLMRADKMMMASSVEGRVPLLDHTVVELAMAMPTTEKVRRGVGKHVLKRAMEDVLPQEILWRRKQAFSTPLAHWLRGELGERFRAQLERGSLNELGYLDRNVMLELVDEHRSGRANRYLQLWALYNLSAWFDHWVAGRD